MNHIIIRRLALMAASVSLSVLACVVLIGTSVLWNYAEASAPVSCQDALQFNSEDAQAVPIAIPCTPLIVENLSTYDGSFFEDGSGREVRDVAAVMLYNSKDTIIPYAFVAIYTENCRYTFEVSMLPPKSAVLVPEQNAKTLKENRIVQAYGWAAGSALENPVKINIEEIGMGSLKITNESGLKIHNLTIYHRTYIPEEEFYMGGTAFITEIPYIAPGETVNADPSNYAAGYSRVVYYECK